MNISQTTSCGETSAHDNNDTWIKERLNIALMDFIQQSWVNWLFKITALFLPIKLIKAIVTKLVSLNSTKSPLWTSFWVCMKQERRGQRWHNQLQNGRNAFMTPFADIAKCQGRVRSGKTERRWRNCEEGDSRLERGWGLELRNIWDKLSSGLKSFSGCLPAWMWDQECKAETALLITGDYFSLRCCSHHPQAWMPSRSRLAKQTWISEQPPEATDGGWCSMWQCLTTFCRSVSA